MVTYDVDGAVVTNCVVEVIGASFASSTTVTNAGTGGATYNGTAANAADFGNGKSGAQDWAFSGASDKITIPHGASVDNFSVGTWEIGFYLSNAATGSLQAIVDKGMDSLGFSIYIGGGGNLYIERDQTASIYRLYNNSSTFASGHYYFLQVTWDCTGYTNAPVVKLSTDGGAPVTLTMSNGSSGTVTAFANDSAIPVTLGNSAANAYHESATIFFYRYHNVLVATGDLTTNFNASVWRLASTWQQRTVPNVALATVLPTIGLGVAQTTVPNVSLATVLPTIGIGKTLTVVPNIALAIVHPTISIGKTLTVVPNVAMAVLVPTVSTSSNIVLTTVPNISLATVLPTVGLNFTQTTVPNVAFATVLPTTGIGVTQTTVPNVAMATVLPAISTSSNIALPTVPNVALDTLAPTISTTSNILQTTVPNVALSTVSPTVSIVTQQETVPDMTFGIILPVVTTQQLWWTWTQTIVPDVSVATLSPMVGINVAQTTVPDVTTQTLHPSVGIRTTQVTVPDMAMEVLLPVVTIAEWEGWLQTVVPDIAMRTLPPSVATRTTQATSPNMAFQIARPAVGISVSPVVPDTSFVALPPTVTVYWFPTWTQTVVPNVAMATNSPPTARIVTTQMVVPGALFRVLQPNVGVSVRPYTVPDFEVAVYEPSVDIAVEPATPDVAYRAYPPKVTIREFNPGSIVRLDGSSATDADRAGSDSAALLSGGEDYDTGLAGSAGDVSLDSSSLDSVELEGAR